VTIGFTFAEGIIHGLAIKLQMQIVTVFRTYNNTTIHKID